MSPIILVVTVVVVEAAQSDWQPIACIPADVPAQAMYDPVRTVDDFEAATLVWNPARGGQCAQALVQRDTNERHGGRASLRVEYRFTGKRDYNEHNFGLIHHQHFNCAAKPGILAMGVYIRTTGGAEFQGLKQSGAAYAARYRRQDGRVAGIVPGTTCLDRVSNRRAART